MDRDQLIEAAHECILDLQVMAQHHAVRAVRVAHVIGMLMALVEEDNKDAE